MFLHELHGEQHWQQIQNTMRKAGYTELGSGADATVWGKDAGSVIKILMPEEGDLAPAERVFLEYYKTAQKYRDNPHFMKFVSIGGQHYTKFDIDGETFYQIAVEKLQPLPYNSFEEAVVWAMSEMIANKQTWSEAVKHIADPTDKLWQYLEGDNAETVAKQVAAMSKTDLKKLQYLYLTMQLLYQIGRKQGFGWDLHTENAMQRSDGTIVITDPWYSTMISENFTQAVAEAFDFDRIPDSTLWEEQEEDLRQELLKQPRLFENTTDFIDLKKFLDQFKFDNIKIGRSYLYTSVASLIPGHVISVAHFNTPHKLVGIKNNRVFFEVNGKIKQYPESGDITGDLLKQIFLFSTSDDFSKFIMLLNLKFSEWNVKTKVLDINDKQGVAEKVNPAILKHGYTKEKNYGDIRLVAQQQDLEEVFPSFVITAYDGNKKIAAVRFSVRDLRRYGFDKAKDAFLVSANTKVDPEYRKRGIAKAMYDFARELGMTLNPAKYRPMTVAKCGHVGKNLN